VKTISCCLFTGYDGRSNARGKLTDPLLLIMYTSPLNTLISSLSLNHHLYADDITFPDFSSTWHWLICCSSSKCSATHILLDDWLLIR